MTEYSKAFWKYAIIILISYFGGILSCLHYQAISKAADQKNGVSASVEWKQNHFKLTGANLMEELIAQGCMNPQDAYADAMLCSDSLKAASCTLFNNIFAMCDGEGKYIKYDHWTESVSDYLSKRYD